MTDDPKFFFTEIGVPNPEEEKNDGPIGLNDIADFGNQPVQSLSSGALVYEIEISGIDSPELRSELEAVLIDKKLGMPAYEYLPKIVDGVLKLNEVHPVKAAVLVGRLKLTHLHVTWKTSQLIKKIIFLIVSTYLLGEGTAVFASDWGRHEVSLKQATIKINNLQDDILTLSKKKSAESEQQKKEEILEEIKKKYTELKVAHREMLKEMEHVRFEHPEKGDKTFREYKRVKLKKLEEIESDNSVDSQMLRLKSKADQKYNRNSN